MIEVGSEYASNYLVQKLKDFHLEEFGKGGVGEHFMVFRPLDNPSVVISFVYIGKSGDYYMYQCAYKDEIIDQYY